MVVQPVVGGDQCSMSPTLARLLPSKMSEYVPYKVNDADFVVGAFGAACGPGAPFCAIGILWAWQASGADGVFNDKVNDAMFHTMPNLSPFSNYWDKYYRWRHLRWKAKRKR